MCECVSRLTYSELEIIKRVFVDVVQFLLDGKCKSRHGNDMSHSSCLSCQPTGSHVCTTNGLDLFYSTEFRLLKQLCGKMEAQTD